MGRCGVRCPPRRARLWPDYAYRRNSLFDGLVSWWPAEDNYEDVVDGNEATRSIVSFTNGFVGKTFVFDGNRTRSTSARMPISICRISPSRRGSSVPAQPTLPLCNRNGEILWWEPAASVSDSASRQRAHVRSAGSSWSRRQSSLTRTGITSR
jgi:hypothetical protein